MGNAPFLMAAFKFANPQYNSGKELSAPEYTFHHRVFPVGVVELSLYANGADHRGSCPLNKTGVGASAQKDRPHFAQVQLAGGLGDELRQFSHSARGIKGSHKLPEVQLGGGVGDRLLPADLF